MTVHTGLLRLETEGEGQIVDLTEGVLAVVGQSGVSQGLVSVFVTGSTAAGAEYEPGGVQDLGETLERLVRARPRARVTTRTTSSTATTTPMRICARRSSGPPRRSRSWVGAWFWGPGSSLS